MLTWYGLFLYNINVWMNTYICILHKKSFTGLILYFLLHCWWRGAWWSWASGLGCFCRQCSCTSQPGCGWSRPDALAEGPWRSSPPGQNPLLPPDQSEKRQRKMWAKLDRKCTVNIEGWQRCFRGQWVHIHKENQAGKKMFGWGGQEARKKQVLLQWVSEGVW